MVVVIITLKPAAFWYLQDEKTKAQIIANLLYVYNTSWQLESVPVLVGNHSAKVSSLSDPKITKKDVSQVRIDR